MNRSQNTFLPALGIVVLSLLLSSVVSNAAALSSLNVTVSVAKDPISRGSVESGIVKVTSSGKAIANANVHGIVVYESGFTKSFTGKTDANGLWTFSWQIGSNSNPGIFIVHAKASKTGFDFGNTDTSFTVTAASGKLKKY